MFHITDTFQLIQRVHDNRSIRKRERNKFQCKQHIKFKIRWRRSFYSFIHSFIGSLPEGRSHGTELSSNSLHLPTRLSASPQLITHSHIGRSSGFIISALPKGRYIAPNNHNPIQYCSLFPTSSTTSSLLPVPYLSWGECFLRWVPSSFLKFLHLVAFYDTQEY